MAEHGPEADPLPRVAELLDVSLITVTEGTDGEPRVGMLETIREFALERLERSGDLTITRRRHAEYYAALAEQALGQLRGPASLAWLDRLEAEHGNFRAALSWSLDARAADQAGAGKRTATGLRLVRALTPFWYQHGHAARARRWLERAVELASDGAGAPLAQVVHGLGVLVQQQGQDEAALRLFERSLTIWRDLNDRDNMARELNSIGITRRCLGELDSARSSFEDSIAIARELRSDARLATALVNLGQVEIDAGNVTRAMEVLHEALALDRQRGDTWAAAISQHLIAAASLREGRVQEARDLLSSILGDVVGSGDIELLAAVLELSAAAAARLGDSKRAALLTGAAENIRETAGMPIPRPDAALLDQFLTPARATISREVWDAELAAGRALTQQQAITLLTPSLTRGIPK
jgi:tetratricopeptide (TPR) repeat protein